MFQSRVGASCGLGFRFEGLSVLGFRGSGLGVEVQYPQLDASTCGKDW